MTRLNADASDASGDRPPIVSNGDLCYRTCTLRPGNPNCTGKGQAVPLVVSGENRVAMLVIFTATLLIVLASVLVVGCTSSDPSASAQEGPTLQLVGTKPDSIRMRLTLRYVTQSEENRCKSFTTETMSMKPLQRVDLVFTQDPGNIFVPGGDEIQSRVVPFSRRSETDNMNSFRWNVDLSWNGKPKGCEFAPQSVGITLFDSDGNDLGGTSLRSKSWPAERGAPPAHEYLDPPITIRCSKRDEPMTSSPKVITMCLPVQGRGGIFEATENNKDTIQVSLDINK